MRGPDVPVARSPRSAHHLPRSAAGLGQARRDRARAGCAPGGHRLRRDRLGQDHAVAEDLPRTRPRPGCRRPRADRPHAAAAPGRDQCRQAHRRGVEHPAGRGRRLPGALPGPPAARRQRQADDRRHPAGRDAVRPAAAPVRHGHRRRSARAQPQHRLPARPPAADPAAPPRPEGRRDLGDDRRRALRPPLRERAGPGAGRAGQRPALPGRAALAAVRGAARPRPR